MTLGHRIWLGSRQCERLLLQTRQQRGATDGSLGKSRLVNQAQDKCQVKLKQAKRQEPDLRGPGWKK